MVGDFPEVYSTAYFSNSISSCVIAYRAILTAHCFRNAHFSPLGWWVKNLHWVHSGQWRKWLIIQKWLKFRTTHGVWFVRRKWIDSLPMTIMWVKQACRFETENWKKMIVSPPAGVIWGKGFRDYGRLTVRFLAEIHHGGNVIRLDSLQLLTIGVFKMFGASVVFWIELALWRDHGWEYYRGFLQT